LHVSRWQTTAAEREGTGTREETTEVVAKYVLRKDM